MFIKKLWYLYFHCNARNCIKTPFLIYEGWTHVILPTQFLNRFYLFVFRWREMEGEREGNIYAGEKHWWAASCMGPDWRPVLQPRHVPCPGMELATFHFVGWHPVNWATPVRDLFIIIKNHPIFILSHWEH